LRRMKSIAVVIPVYNSEKTLEELYRRLSTVLIQLTKHYTIIMVDDGSTDGSYAKMCTLHSEDQRVKAIKLKKNYGQQNAIMCGLHYTESDFVVIMDDDIQNPPEEIEKLLAKIEVGYDVVYGIPDQKHDAPERLLGTVMRDILFRVLFKMPKNIKVSSFRILRKRLVDRIIQSNTSFVYISAIIFHGEYEVKVANVRVAHTQKPYGHSRYTLRKLVILYLRIFMTYNVLFSRFADRSQPQFEIADSRI